jgi:transcriptional antiterminator
MYEPSKDETKEEYVKIWFHFSVGHLNQRQIAELFGCSEDTVRNAIKWCAENRLNLDIPILAEAAKEALENRLRELKNDLVRIKESNPINWNAVIGINRLIKDNEELLWKLQAVIQDKSFITVNNTQINQVVKARDEATEVLNEGERKELASRIREITGKQANN